MATFYEAYLAKESWSTVMLSAATAPNRQVVGMGVGYADPKQPQKGAAVILYTSSTNAAESRGRDVKVWRKGRSVTVPVRVIPSGGFKAHVAPYTNRIRPVPAGYSVGTPLGSGTAGLVVINNPARTQLFILSNNHVLNKDNSSGYTETIQPGGVDGGRTGVDRIGRLDRFIRLSKTGDNYIDAAISIPLRNSLLNPRYATVGVLPGHVSGYSVGTRFKKVGRTTGRVQGTVQSIHTDIMVNYGTLGGLGTIRFKNQTIVTSSTPISLPGDSGSVWLRSDNNYAAAVNFAGSAAGTLSVCFPVHWAMQAFGLRVATPARGAGRILRAGTGFETTRPLSPAQLSRLRVRRAAGPRG